MNCREQSLKFLEVRLAERVCLTPPESATRLRIHLGIRSDSKEAVFSTGNKNNQLFWGVCHDRYTPHIVVPNIPVLSHI